MDTTTTNVWNYVAQSLMMDAHAEASAVNAGYSAPTSPWGDA